MKLDELAGYFLAVEEVVQSETNLGESWRRVLDVTRQSTNRNLCSLDLQDDSENLSSQAKQILRTEQLPADASFLYFGLFDRLNQDKKTVTAGFYIAGGKGDPDTSLSNGEFNYFPENRFLQSIVLNTIREIARRSPDSQIIDYAVLFGAAAILAKNISARLTLNLPVFVGFDSGDYARVSR